MFAAEPFATEVADDAIEVCREASPIGVVPRQANEERDECFLREVFRGTVRAGDGASKPKHDVLIAALNLRERLAIAASRPADDIWVWWVQSHVEVIGSRRDFVSHERSDRPSGQQVLKRLLNLAAPLSVSGNGHWPRTRTVPSWIGAQHHDRCRTPAEVSQRIAGRPGVLRREAVNDQEFRWL